MKPKIVQITAIDGSMNNMLNLLNKKTYEAGFEVHCICSPGPGVEKLLENGYIYHPVNIERKISLKSNLQSIYKIYKILKKVKPDIVHVHTPIASVIGRIAAKLANVKNIIYTAHGFYFHEGMAPSKYKLYFNIEKYVGRFFTDYIFTQSREDYVLAKTNNFLKKQGNYYHISNGVDTHYQFNIDKFGDEIKNKIQTKHKIEGNPIIISFVGRLVKEKGVLDLLHSFKQIKEDNLVLFVIGEVPESERDHSLKSVVMEFDNVKNIIFTGKVSNVNEYLYTSDIFILPSYREGMPRSIIEAMAMKNAIIATNIRGSREEVDNGKNGILVNVGQPEKLKAKIEYLIENPKILNSMKEKSLRKAKTLYDEEKVVKTQLEVFHKLV